MIARTLLLVIILLSMAICAQADWGRQVISKPDIINVNTAAKTNVTELVVPHKNQIMIYNPEKGLNITYEESSIAEYMRLKELSKLVGNANETYDHSNAPILNMTPEEWGKYRLWLFNVDTVHERTWVKNEYNCLNFTMDSIKAAIDAGFTKLYFAYIENFRGNEHAAVGAHVVGPGVNEWLVSDPQNGCILNEEMRKNNATENVTFFRPSGFYVIAWNPDSGGLRSMTYSGDIVHQETM